MQAVMVNIKIRNHPRYVILPTQFHGWINPSMSSLCHVKIILTEKEQVVLKPEEEVEPKKKKNLRKKC